ncbi:hypothetical protein LCGC14_0955010 [marine sediment metagenome]|uniref:Thymidylate synthase (FAD) n=1 Tax=marine sediment metagenome TaxID=412755 RepID=A0A0F9NG20_9ZZZZ
MEVVEMSATIMYGAEDEQSVLEKIERIGRVAYKSEDKITETSAAKFVRMLRDRGHESVLEHHNVTVHFIIDRGVSHELVRHRLAAYTQESTRYVNYGKRGMKVVVPEDWSEHPMEMTEWLAAMETCEEAYNALLSLGAKPQIARSVLPNALKTEVVATMNLRQWRHVIRQRIALTAHPQMRKVMLQLFRELKATLPTFFEDIEIPE